MIRIFVIMIAAMLLSVSAHATTVVRVGIVAYQDFDREVERYEQFFVQLSTEHPEFDYEIAVGSYGEVLHWTERQLVDLAILTPGVFASVVSDEPDAATCQYLASVQLPPAAFPLAPEKRRSDGFFDSYHSVCVTTKDGEIADLDDLRRATKDGSVKFLFVHPKSLSGYIAPLHALRQAGIQPTDDQIQFTYSHTQSLRLLNQSASTDTKAVAFVWDDVDVEASMTEPLASIAFDELDQLALPRNVIVAANGFSDGETIGQWIDGMECDPFRFSRLTDWREKFQPVRDWLAEADALAVGPETLSMEEVVQSLQQYARSQPSPPRLALVLSGGGAKCSYQVGAVSALEERLAKLRADTGDESFDIQLVVGTSGGAINSVPVALGISRTEEGRKSFGSTWRGLDQREIVRLPRLMRINMGVWFAALQTAIVIWIVRRYVPDLKKRGESFAIIYTVLAAFEVCLGYFPIRPWSMLGENHVLHHLWLWLSFGVRSSAWALLAIGVAALCWEQIRSRRGSHIEIPKWLTNAMLAGAVFGLPALQLIMLLFWQPTISTGSGMEHSLAEKFPTLINDHLRNLGQESLQVDATTDADRLQQVSAEVIRRGLLQRDLVLTGSCLSQTSEELPSDLYFFAPTKRLVSSESADGAGETDASEPNIEGADSDTVRPPFGARGVSLADRPDILLDVVMGSGSIFPVFPGRMIDGIPRAGERIELVDGGFAHNSPVEAAVLWDATHIVLIEAKPRKRNERGNFVLNATSAFRHLHSQAQLLDTRSRGRVTIYTVAPKPPHICVLDFAENLIDDSIRRGYDEVQNGSETFHRELGEPVFRPVGS